MGLKYITDMEEKNRKLTDLRKEIECKQNEDPQMMIEALQQKIGELNLELTECEVKYRDVDANRDQLVQINYSLLKETAQWRTSFDNLNRDF